MKENAVNFISLTPGTSLDTGTSMGRSDERALLFHLVAAHMGEERVSSPGWLELFRGRSTLENFLRDIGQVDVESLDPRLVSKFSLAFSRARGPYGGLLEVELAEAARRFESGQMVTAVRLGAAGSAAIDVRQARRLIGTLRRLGRFKRWLQHCCFGLIVVGR